MKRARFSEEQITEILKTAVARPIRETFPTLQRFLTERVLSVIAKTQRVFSFHRVGAQDVLPAL